MKKLNFSCTLLSDIVLSAETATEGFYKSLEYIPGAKFLGIVAGSLYDESNPKRTMDLFHNGSVRFGDAHISFNSTTETYKTPFSWQFIKGESLKDKIYLHHELTTEDRLTLISNGKQLKQAKDGYLSESMQLLETGQIFSIKSAYNSDKYRAEDEQMYGYFALQSGSVYTFCVDLDDTQYVDLVKKALVGKRRIGRSSSAEYGLVEIDFICDKQEEYVDIEASIIYLYAKSNLCFYDKFHKSTIVPDVIEHLLMPLGSNIIWEKSQIRYRPYKTWNQHRNNRDADRIIIEKGSVFAVQLSSLVNTSTFAKGIGAHRSEGFGQVCINPRFLNGSQTVSPAMSTESSNDKSTKYHYVVNASAEDTMLISYLKNKSSNWSLDQQIDGLVNQFIQKYSSEFESITNSQWGQIRAVAKQAEYDEYFKKLAFDENIGFCYKGQSESNWRKGRDTLKNFLFGQPQLKGTAIIILAVKLASEMSKRSKK